MGDAGRLTEDAGTVSREDSTTHCTSTKSVWKDVTTMDIEMLTLVPSMIIRKPQ